MNYELQKIFMLVLQLYHLHKLQFFLIFQIQDLHLQITKDFNHYLYRLQLFLTLKNIIKEFIKSLLISSLS